MSPSAKLGPRFSSAIEAAFGSDFRGADAVLRPSQFADVQANAALALAKQLGIPPREAATKIVDHLDIADMCEAVEVSGPGFINIRFRDEWVASQATALNSDSQLGVPEQSPQRIVIDYSAPNVAKEMHVGHLRTTVVGDALARTLGHLGHHIIRQNHIGDWGTPFGMLIEHLLEVGEDSPDALLLETDPNAFYQAARAKFDTDAEFATRSRARVVALQAGDPETLRLWSGLIELSKHYFNRIYSRLGVTLTDADLAGESKYNDDLPIVCDQLEAAGIATMSDGALCVFLDGYTGREGKPVPLIIRKSDGGYGYGTTDLATIKHRVDDLKADRILYVVGATQALHLNMVWDTARKAGWLPDRVTAEHVQIGNVLGDDRKILKTRSGKPVRLMALLDEAIARARAVIDEANPDLDPDIRAAIAPKAGMGAVKYADLSVGHNSEYVFNMDRMVAQTGNTGPYLQYASARIRSIFRTAGVDPSEVTTPLSIHSREERALCLRLLEFGDVVAEVGKSLEPHRLCTYLFELSQTFTGFYEHCPVLRAEPEARASRLALCALTLRVLVTGLELLGLEAPERM